jgi:hypothetical protein
MKKCGVCQKEPRELFLNNKKVCLPCDELLIDIEIECDDEPKAPVRRKEGSIEPEQASPKYFLRN